MDGGSDAARVSGAVSASTSVSIAWMIPPLRRVIDWSAMWISPPCSRSSGTNVSAAAAQPAKADANGVTPLAAAAAGGHESTAAMLRNAEAVA